MNPLVAPWPSEARGHGRTALSVNVNKIALLRNTRHLNIPDVVALSRTALEAGAQGITVHPRPDARHIRHADVLALAALLKAWPQAEFNIEGNPEHNLLQVAAEVRAAGLPLHQLTYVPDAVNQFTSDHGWRLAPGDAADLERLRLLVAQGQVLGARVSLFMDAQPQAMALAAATGAQRVELYTEVYASAHGSAAQSEVLKRYADSARAALAAGLQVNAGHDLNRANLADFLAAVPGVAEVSIGHALIADALTLGLAETVRDYQRCIQRACAAQEAAR